MRLDKFGNALMLNDYVRLLANIKGTLTCFKVTKCVSIALPANFEPRQSR